MTGIPDEWVLTCHEPYSFVQKHTHMKQPGRVSETLYDETGSFIHILLQRIGSERAADDAVVLHLRQASYGLLSIACEPLSDINNQQIQALRQPLTAVMPLIVNKLVKPTQVGPTKVLSIAVHQLKRRAQNSHLLPLRLFS